ncbi:unnamed protein product [Adineta ricciae]|uniref:Uncharacterized protein n=1 Tax=Adineta ricciae TaxID=249248 RepID=A0A816ER33_ADIRI|nr:unnamed protein product [Adineta ricciae]
MSETSGQCEDESCSKQSNKISRVFPCLYHCKKMLCIQHLSEHDKYIEKQLQYQNQLEGLWKTYRVMFNEEKIEEEYLKLKTKLENFRQLGNEIERLLLMKNFHDSMENNQKLQAAVQIVQKAIAEDNREKVIMQTVLPKSEFGEENSHALVDFGSLSSPDASNDDSETGDSFPLFSNTDRNSPTSVQDDEYGQNMDEYDEQENHAESEDEDNLMDETTFRQANTCENNVTPHRGIVASKIRDYCPLTYNGAFGINSQAHGVRLCPQKSLEHRRTYRLNEHFRRVHHLTGFASLALARAVGAGKDPTTTRLFSDHDIILNIDELRTVNCPITQPFVHHRLLQIENSPCSAIKQVRQLREHLKRSHKFSSRAANIIVKAVKSDIPVHTLQFPKWIDVIED